jgi:nucleoside-diphosphate-sugar epimerase
VIVAVTGATGNIGSAVVDRLLAAGHEVRGVARRAPSGSRAGLTWTELDLAAADRDTRLRAVLDGVDAAVHTAWGFQPTRDLAYLQRLDVGGTAAVVRAAAAVGVPHLVHVSSQGAYSPAPDTTPVAEDWPTGGAAPELPYSRHKAAAERVLDAHEAVPGHRPLVARVRPSLVVRGEAGGAVARYMLPSLVPEGVLRLLPVLPLDRRFRLQVTHTDDVADAIVAVVLAGATGPFNLAAEPVLGRDDVARALGTPAVHLPWPVLRAAAGLGWALRLQPFDPGWLDMARVVPTLSSARAREELGWQPAHDARDALTEAVAGMAAGEGGGSPALRPRRWVEQLVHLLRRGPVSRRPTA